MSQLGISIYPDFFDYETIYNYLKRAHELGFKKVFISLILNNLKFKNTYPITSKGFDDVFKLCKKFQFEVTVDINEEVFSKLGCTLDNLDSLKDRGIRVLRIDSGFDDEACAKLTHNPWGIQIELNASYEAILKETLEVIKQKGNISQVRACYNFYPRIGTGLAIESIQKIILMLKQMNVPVGAFIASQYAPKDIHRPGHGICTIEEHRYLPPEYSMKELVEVGIDYVYIGDSMANDRELLEIATAYHKAYLEIPIVFNQYINESNKEKILSLEFTSRMDQPQYLIRTEESRGIEVIPCYCANRPRYSVTLDNNKSLRYMGELQIMLEDMGACNEANVIGFVHPFGIHLLKHIQYGKSAFRLVPYKTYH